MTVRSALRKLRIAVGCRLSGRWYDWHDIQWHLDSVDRLHREAAWHPLGCEIEGCDRVAAVVLKSASFTTYQVCRPCKNALRRGFDDEPGPTSAGWIEKPQWLSKLSDKTVRPPSERENWE